MGKQKSIMGVFGKALGFAVAGAGSALILKNELSFAHASGDAVHATVLNWPHTQMFSSYDHAALRRGFQVYRQVCSACHSIDRLAFRQLVGVTHSEAEMKAMAKEYQIVDEDPDAEGNPVLRPGKLTDNFPGPYKNEMEARAGNNGALPPDFRLIRHARTSCLDGKAGEDYIYHLLTGYCDPPAGVTVAEGQAYNPYFQGGAISMPQQLYNDGVEYDDGTVASVSQMAKDVCEFFRYTAEPEYDDRKKMAMQALTIFGILFATSYYW